jgi:hypothetical protein
VRGFAIASTDDFKERVSVGGTAFELDGKSGEKQDLDRRSACIPKTERSKNGKHFLEEESYQNGPLSAFGQLCVTLKRGEKVIEVIPDAIFICYTGGLQESCCPSLDMNINIFYL